MPGGFINGGFNIGRAMFPVPFGSRFSPAARDYFARLDAAGLRVGKYDLANAALIDRLVANGGNLWPASGAFNAMAGYLYPGNGEDLIPLKDGHDAGTLNAFVSGDWNAVTGLKGDGSTKYVDSNRNNNADGQDDNSAGAYISEFGSRKALEALLGGPFGVFGQRAILRTDTPELVLRAGDLNTIFQSLDLAVGLNAATRNSSTGLSYLIGGTAGTVTTASENVPSSSVAIFARGSTAIQDHVHHRLPFYHLGPNLNGTGELAELDAALTEWKNALASA